MTKTYWNSIKNRLNEIQAIYISDQVYRVPDNEYTENMRLSINGDILTLTFDCRLGHFSRKNGWSKTYDNVIKLKRTDITSVSFTEKVPLWVSRRPGNGSYCRIISE